MPKPTDAAGFGIASEEEEDDDEDEEEEDEAFGKSSLSKLL